MSHGPDASLHQVMPLPIPAAAAGGSAVFSAAVMDVILRAAHSSGVHVCDEKKARADLTSAYTALASYG